MTMYKAFVRPQLDYGDITYDEAYNETFLQRLEFIQYNGWLSLSELSEDRQEKTLPQIRLGTPPASTLVQETLPIL